MSETIRYSYVANTVSHEGAIKINIGRYTGLIFSYGKVKFEENKNTDRMNVAFEYNVHKTPDKCQDDWEDGDLVDFLGDILIEVLDDKLQEGNLETFFGSEM